MSRRERGRVFVGTSGWSNDGWKGRFYPEDWPKRRWFEYYAGRFGTVELNATFYRLFPATTFAKWGAAAPAGFVYAVKMWRVITHLKRISGLEEEVKVFLERAMELGDSLGPVLVQLPPSLKRDDERLGEFLEVLTDARAQMPRDVRVAMEFRHGSWNDPAVFERLGEADVGLCLVDMAGLEFERVVTGDFAYIRFHGRVYKYATLYTREELGEWAGWIEEQVGAGRDVYVYFNNDYNAYAVENARELGELLGLETENEKLQLKSKK